MRPQDYYQDLKYCPACEKYVPYLMSLDHSYCAECGDRVRLFSKSDWENFNENIARKPKGRPRKPRGRESA
jgi:hypothetical protein